MKKHFVVLLGVLLVGAGLACWLFLPHSDTSNDPLGMQRDSLQKGEAVLWPEQHAYFRIRDGHWEKSKDIFDSPFVPVATEEASDMLNTHFNLNSGNLGASGEVTNETNVTTLIISYDSLVNIGKQQYENKVYHLAKQTFQQALENAISLDKTSSNELTKNRINEVNDWIMKCDVALMNSANNSSTTQPPVTVKAPRADELKKKEEANKLKAAEEAKLKAEKEAKLKAEKEAKKGANSADDEWDKIILKKNIDGVQVITKEKAIEIWNGLKNKNKPSKHENLHKWNLVRSVKR
jgi:hypothetical protein